ncbi:MAG: isoaspartyl peptidase/L-asparaginase [Anaerolineales bacterium]|nr:isoaspartyl peptidase/L-asparaginase [Anaerolineales bacterium]
MKGTLVAHGGAWDWPDEYDAPIQAAMKEAVARGQAVLAGGGSALEAVVQTVVYLEDNPLFEAGFGGCLNRDGVLQLDALLVDGRGPDFGAVGAVTQVRNPILLARQIMTEIKPRFIVGEGANRMAAELGLPLVENESLISAKARSDFAASRPGRTADTVGAVAIDADGNIAAATSTSGMALKPDGRIGDSPLFGAGGYAHNGIGAAGATGYGENIMRALLSKYACDKMAEGLTAASAGQAAIDHVERLFSNSMAGLILIDAAGNLGAAHSTPKLALGWLDAAGGIGSSVRGGLSQA